MVCPSSFISCFCPPAFDHHQEECCSIRPDQVTAIVLAVLGGCILFSGLYFMFGGIGTLPTQFSGLALSLAGSAMIVYNIVLAFKD